MAGSLDWIFGRNRIIPQRISTKWQSGLFASRQIAGIRIGRRPIVVKRLCGVLFKRKVLSAEIPERTYTQSRDRQSVADNPQVDAREPSRFSSHHFLLIQDLHYFDIYKRLKQALFVATLFDGTRLLC